MSDDLKARLLRRTIWTIGDCGGQRFQEADPDCAEAAARIAELEAALREYEDAFCEGLCAEMPNIADHDCSGCRARAALGKDRADG